MRCARTALLSLAFALPLTAALSLPPVSIYAQQSETISLESNYDGIFSRRDDLQLTLTRSGSTDAELTVTVSITQTDEYLDDGDLTHTVTFGIGDDTAELNIPRIKFENRESVDGSLTVSVEAVTGYDVSGAQKTITVISGFIAGAKGFYTIRPDMPSYEFTEEDTVTTFRLIVKSARTIPRAISNPYALSTIGADDSRPDLTAVSNQDYGLISEFRTIDAGLFSLVEGVYSATSPPIALEIFDDNIIESPETYEIRTAPVPGFGGWLNGGTKFLVTILDNDLPDWSLDKSAATFTESTASTAQVTLNTGGVVYPADRAVSFQFTGRATAEADYTVEDDDGNTLSAPYEVTLEQGEKQVSVILRGAADTVVEEPEAIEVRASMDGSDLEVLANLTILDTTSQISGLEATGLTAWVAPGDSWSQAKARFELCWTPAGVPVSELSDFQLGWTHYFVGETDAWPDDSDRTFNYRDISSEGDCNGSGGIAFSVKGRVAQWLIPDLKHHFRLRAKQGSQQVQSDISTAISPNPAADLKAVLLAPLEESLTLPGEHPDGSPIFAVVPDPVEGPFIVGVRFGSWLEVLGYT